MDPTLSYTEDVGDALLLLAGTGSTAETDANVSLVDNIWPWSLTHGTPASTSNSIDLDLSQLFQLTNGNGELPWLYPSPSISGDSNSILHIKEHTVKSNWISRPFYRSNQTRMNSPAPVSAVSPLEGSFLNFDMVDLMQRHLQHSVVSTLSLICDVDTHTYCRIQVRSFITV